MPLHFVMIRDMEEGDLVHLGFDTWGITKTSNVWQGRFILLLLRTDIGSGWVDIGIMEMPGQDELGLHRFFSIMYQERRVQSGHGGSMS